jgi:predicted permease
MNLGKFWRRLLMFFRMAQFRAGMDEELRSHLAMKAADLREAGMEDNQARHAAQVRLGNLTLLREKSEDAWGWTAVGALLQDLRYALRILRKSPAFTATALLTLALGIGANTAIFSLINAVMLRSMPVRDPGRLVQFAKLWGGQRSSISYPLYRFFRDQSHSFDGLLAQSWPAKQEIAIGRMPERVETQLVSANYYDVLGISATAGHVFTPDDDRVPGSSPYAVISYRYWQRRFGLSPSVIGKAFRLNQTVFTIAGVTPKEFFGTMPGHDPDMTFPLSMDAQVNREFNKGKSWLGDSQTNWLSVMGRLKANTGLRQAEAESRVLFRDRNRADATREKDYRDQEAVLAQKLSLEPAAAGLDSLRVRFSEPLLFLMCIVGLVLLLACTNLSSLLVGRTLSRSREVSIRIAVGAGRGRLLRQFLAESFVLALAGGLLGLALAQLLCPLMIALMANGEEFFLPVHPDPRVLIFTGIISLGTTVAVGLAPALYATRLNITLGLKEVRSTGRRNVFKILIVAQIAISLLLLVGASLFVRTLINLRTLDMGFRREGVLVFGIDSDKAGYKGERLRNLRATMLNRLDAIPAVSSASSILVLMLSGGGWNGTVDVEGYTYRRDENNQADFNEVGPKFFRTMGTPILMGREFDSRDLPSSPKVVIVNQAFARHYFGHRSALGRHVNGGVIVGVAKDSKYLTLREAFARIVYFPALQDASPQSWSNYLVRVDAGQPLRVLPAVREIVKQIDPALEITGPTTLSDVVDKSILNERILASLSSIFAVIAMLLSCFGIFGVMSSYVARRTNEFGIRFALGARRQDVLLAVLSEVAVVLVTGIVIGLIVSVSVTGVARSVLFDLKPTDPLAFAVAALLLSTAALIAGYLPARRAAQIDPVDALRAE